MIRTILLGLVLVTAQALPSEFAFEDNVDAELINFQDGLPYFGYAFFQRQEKIETTEDIITKLRTTFAITNGTKDKILPPAVDSLIQVLSFPPISRAIDAILQKYPELPLIIRGIRIFLTGPDAAPFIAAVRKVAVPLVKAVQTLYERIAVELENTGEIFAEQGVRLFFLLQQPDVIEVLQKFQALPEVIQLAEIASTYGIDLLGSLRNLEEILSSGISIPT